MKKSGMWIFVLCLAVMACRGKGQQGLKGEIKAELVDVGGTRLFTRVMGQGPPILIVHGGPGLGHGYFLPQLEGLAKDHQLIFYDQRLSGRSDNDLDPAEITLTKFVDDIEALRKHFKIDRLNLLAHSWGGILAMQYAIRYPQHLQCLILSNTAGASSETRLEENASLAKKATESDQNALDSIRASPAFQNGESPAYAEFLRAMFRIEFHDRALADDLSLDLSPHFVANSPRLGGLYTDLASYDFHHQLIELEVPVLLVFGDAEPLATLVGPRLSKTFRRARLEVVRDCGHFPFVEQPKAYFSLIRNFIAQYNEKQ